jgi:hypothetical protein
MDQAVAKIRQCCQLTRHFFKKRPAITWMQWRGGVPRTAAICASVNPINPAPSRKR